MKALAGPLIAHGVVLVLSRVLLTCRGYFRAVREYQATRTIAGAILETMG